MATSVPAHRRTFNRAKEHLDAFNQALGRWYDDSAHVDFVEVNKEVSDAWQMPRRSPPDTGEIGFEATFDEEFPINQDWAFLFSDGIHGLRSSLDHLAMSLAETHSGSLTPEQEGQVEFPIFGDRAPTKREWERRVALIRPDAQAIIKELQPHLLGEDYATTKLWVLHDLHNRLEHRRPLLVTEVSTGSGLINPGMGKAKIGIGQFIAPASLKEGTKLMRIFITPGPNGEVDVNPDFAVDVVPEEGYPSLGSAMRTHSVISEFIQTSVFAPLEPFL